VLRSEVAWACHLGLQAALLPPPRPRAINYARCVKQLCQRIAGQQQLWLRVPLTQPLDFHDQCRSNSSSSSSSSSSSDSSSVNSSDGWYVWDAFRHMCGHDRRLFVALELTQELPPAPALAACVARWGGEPVVALIVPTRLFLTNKGGFPVLGR
jgi:protein arginine N-methyltransferase 5